MPQEKKLGQALMLPGMLYYAWPAWHGSKPCQPDVA